MVAVALLLGAIVVLQILGQETLQPGLTAMFATLFAGSVAILTNARTAEIFGATVLVVLSLHSLGEPVQVGDLRG